MDPSKIVENAVRYATIAVEKDTAGDKISAIENYTKAASMLHLAASQANDRNKSEQFLAKASEYEQRAATLGMGSQNDEDRDTERCIFLFEQAMDADEQKLKDVAIELYTQMVEFGLKIKFKDINKKTKLYDWIKQAIARAEELKGITPTSSPKHEDISSKMSAMSCSSSDNNINTNPPQRSVGISQKVPLHRGSSVHLKLTTGSDMYSDEEKLVLLKTSQINNNEYVPFMSIDLTENFRYPVTFTDRDGILPLSVKQKRAFKAWARPDQICSDPKLILGQHIDCFSIKQTVISDCSFVASLAIAALYEKRFKKRLITSIIYPKKRNGEPILNPFGKYMIKLHLNGVPRKIIIDDLLPVDSYNQLLCSYSSNKNEFWVSLLEKAYMKVMGGYDFPGSNSNIDLHALTGWIPERSAIRINESDFNADALFENIRKSLESGNLLATVATGELSPLQEERTGLVPTHAYAVFDARIVNGVKLFQLKNPWSHLRWRGNYSELDTVHWTPELRKTLHYDPDQAATYDNGVFWIDYNSILHFFDVFYMNWNPEIFQYTYCIHQLWNSDSGPIRDAYNVGDNPQFSLEVQGCGEIWILLTRHITQIDDFKENKEYITVLVYKNNGKRVYYPYDPPPYIDGVRINSPHYLCKMKIGPDSAKKYTLVISQYEKMVTIYYTLRVYGTAPFTLRKLSAFPHEKKIVGEWKGKTAGGCGNHRNTYHNNPKYVLTVPDSTTTKHLVIYLRGPKEYQVGAEVFVVSLSDPSITAPFVSKSSEPYRSGFAALELPDIPSGKYKMMVSTFYPNQEGPFILNVKSTVPLTIAQLES